ncbi:hypothetical protein BD289DRAFT_432420, partial [Coniella lustricola]
MTALLLNFAAIWLFVLLFFLFFLFCRSIWLSPFSLNSCLFGRRKGKRKVAGHLNLWIVMEDWKAKERLDRINGYIGWALVRVEWGRGCYEVLS